ncbi:MAG: hypothetical protein K2Y35_12720 [Burkholderiales bacterium]|nr:hypothetical protein [Burkholderiales bacterium]
MRILGTLKADAASEAGAPPKPELMERVIHRACENQGQDWSLALVTTTQVGGTDKTKRRSRESTPASRLMDVRIDGRTQYYHCPVTIRRGKESSMCSKTIVTRALLASVLVAGAMTHAFGGDVKLISDHWDNVCGVEVTWGPDAPNDTPVEFHTDVSKGWSVTKPGRLCYRRASTPDNCESGMTQWKTQWRCAASTGSGTEELSLK